MKKKWTDLNVVILGLSVTGESVARYLRDKGANCIISESRNPNDSDTSKIKDLESIDIKVEMGGNNPETIINADIIITSPGIKPSSDPIILARKNKIKLISEPELAFRETSIPIVAITGTNGKSTTTTLVSEIFEKAGYKAPSCGNIGNPIINEIKKDNDYLIAEISSFQLEYSSTFKPQIGVFLNYTPDHIDWHGSAEEYLKVKTAFLKGSRSPFWAVLNANDKAVFRFESEVRSDVYWFGREVPGKSTYIKDDQFVINEKGNIENILPLSDLQIKGKHNHENVMAAIATARQAGIKIKDISDAIKSFKGIEHRLEYVTTIDGIDFYNDSKATNCDSTICALRSFSNEKLVLIAGGRDKGTDLTDLVKEIINSTNSVILIGEATERFAEALTKANYSPIYKEETLEKAVDLGLKLQQGPVVLSPACASFDMFKNFEDRGNVFKDILKKKKSES